jgi:glutamate-1-semialdehyde aminotransferase
VVVRVDSWCKDQTTVNVGHFRRFIEKEIEVRKQTTMSALHSRVEEQNIAEAIVAGVSNMQSVRYLPGGSHVTSSISLIEPRHTTAHRVIYDF